MKFLLPAVTLTIWVFVSATGLVAQTPPTTASSRETQEGLGALIRGDIEKAETLLLEAHRATPNDVATLLGLSQLYEEKGDLSTALLHARRAEELEPDTPGTALAVGGLLAQLGQTEEALEKLRRASRLDPKNDLALVLILR